jgi:hypothetical protein
MSLRSSGREVRERRKWEGWQGHSEYGWVRQWRPVGTGDDSAVTGVNSYPITMLKVTGGQSGMVE